MNNNITNDDIYQYLTGILRKSRKGNALDPDTFTKYLQTANLEYWNKEWEKLGGTYRDTETFKPFLANHSDYISNYYVQLPSDYFLLLTETIMYNGNKVDFISQTEYADRVSDELTQPTATNPIAYFKEDSVSGAPTSYYIYIGGVETDGSNLLSFMYLKEPDEPFYDYYIDANSEVQYLTEGQSAYTLQTGEVYRDGTTSGSVTSTSKELDWRDYDKIKIQNIILGYLGVQLEDQASYQHSNLQEQQDDILK